MLPAVQQCCFRASTAMNPAICPPLEGSGPSWKVALTNFLRWVSVCDVCSKGRERCGLAYCWPLMVSRRMQVRMHSAELAPLKATTLSGRPDTCCGSFPVLPCPPRLLVCKVLHKIEEVEIDPKLNLPPCPEKRVKLCFCVTKVTKKATSWHCCVSPQLVL